MGTESDNIELSPEEHQELLKYDSCSFGFLKLDKPEEEATKQLLEKGVHFYESVIRAAVKATNKEKNEKPHIEPVVFCRLGHLLLLLEQFEKALSAYQKYYQLQEDNWKNSPFLYGLGFAYFHFNAYQLATRAFQQVLYTDPGFVRANEIHIRLGFIFKIGKDFEKSLKHFRHALSDSSPCSLTKAQIKLHIAHLYEVQGKYKQAKEAYEQFINSKEGVEDIYKATANKQLGWLYHTVESLGDKATREELAVRHLQESLNYDRSNGQTWYLLGRCFSSLGKVHDAFVSYRSSIDKSEASADTWCSIGSLMSKLYHDNEMSVEMTAAVEVIQHQQADQQKSVTSTERKMRIVQHIFHRRTETLCKINLFRGLLEYFQGYVKMFQSVKPMAHILHENMFDTVQQFVGMFIKVENIPEGRVSKLVKLDVADRSIQKSDKNLGVGKYAYTSLNKARLEKKNQHWLNNLYTNLRTGYVKAAQKLLALPLENQVLRHLSVLDPELVRHSQVSQCFKSLAKKLPNVIGLEEEGHLAVEADKYVTDKDVLQLSRSVPENHRIDCDFWTYVFKLKDFTDQRYPKLQKLVCSLLSIFSGPLVEGTFNIMDDIIEKDRSNMSVESYESVAIIKTALKRKGTKATKMIVTPAMKKATVFAYQTYKQYLRTKKEQAEKAKQEKLNSSVQLLKMAKAKHLAKLLRSKKRKQTLKNKMRAERVKRRHSDEHDSSNKRWKRIKLT